MNVKEFVLKNGREYRKIAQVWATRAIEGEIVQTVINGQVETTKVCKEGEYLIQGAAGEFYAVPKDTFESRYDVTDEKKNIGDREYLRYNPKGTIQAAQYFGPTFGFEVAWGNMICMDGDYLAVNGESIYRIERDVFGQTYEPV